MRLKAFLFLSRSPFNKKYFIQVLFWEEITFARAELLLLHFHFLVRRSGKRCLFSFTEELYYVLKSHTFIEI